MLAPAGVVDVGGRLVRGAADVLWSLLFPERCVGCGRFETQLCDPCRARLEAVGGPVCRRCGHPVAGRSIPPTGTEGGPAYCARCAGLEGFVRARSAFVYDGVARRLVTAFKHDGRRNLGGLMAGLAEESFAEFLQEVGHPVVTWVPAHAASVRSRGYNQSEVLAKQLARAAGGVPVVPLARKVARTRHQKALGREQRRQNLRGAFVPLVCGQRTVPDRGRGLRSRSVGCGAEGVVMVDDVYTTGATAQEVADVIGQSTGLPVHVFTFCRTVAAGDGSLA